MEFLSWQARIKPDQDKVQLKVELDTGVRYNKEKGEAYQSAADGKILRPDTDLYETFLGSFLSSVCHG